MFFNGKENNCPVSVTKRATYMQFKHDKKSNSCYHVIIFEDKDDALESFICKANYQYEVLSLVHAKFCDGELVTVFINVYQGRSFVNCFKYAARYRFCLTHLI